MSAPTPPDIRSVLEKLLRQGYDLSQKPHGIYGGYKEVDEALQAISAVVLGCAPEKHDLTDIDYVLPTDNYLKAQAHNKAIDLYTDNLHAVLGGTKENT